MPQLKQIKGLFVVVMATLVIAACNGDGIPRGEEMADEISVNFDLLALGLDGSSQALLSVDTVILLDSSEVFGEAQIVRNIRVVGVSYTISNFNPGDLDTSFSSDFIYQTDSSQAVFGVVENVNVFVAEESQRAFLIPVEQVNLDAMAGQLETFGQMGMVINTQIDDLPAGFNLAITFDITATVVE